MERIVFRHNVAYSIWLDKEDFESKFAKYLPICITRGYKRGRSEEPKPYALFTPEPGKHIRLHR